MKSHGINIHEPSHLSEHNSSVGFTEEGDGRRREETGMGEGLSWQRHGEPITQQAHLSSLFLWIRCDVHRGLLFEPWTHPAKLHHLLPHMWAGGRGGKAYTHTQTPTSHIFPGDYNCGLTWEGFQHSIVPGVSDCLWWCERHLWLHTQDVRRLQPATKQAAKACKSQKRWSALCLCCKHPPFCVLSHECSNLPIVAKAQGFRCCSFMWKGFQASAMPEQRTILQALAEPLLFLSSCARVGKTRTCMAMDRFMKTDWLRCFGDTRTSRCQQDHFSFPLSHSSRLKKKKKKGTEGMCETCNHGYPLALSLVTRYRWKTPVVVVDQLWGKAVNLV